MIKKLRIKFVVINMSIVTLMLCVILGLVLYFTGANLETESVRMMQSIASQPVHLSVPDELGEEVRLPFFTLQLGPRGELISTGGGYYDLSDDAFLNSLIQAAYASPRQLGVLEEYNLRYYRAENPLNPCLVFSDISSERATLNGLMKSCLLIGGLGFFVFLGASILLSKWAVKPVDRAWRQQRQFVAAASHELKTPLTVILTNTELLENPDFGEEKRAAFVSGIGTMARQMKGLIEQMLELARAESGETVRESRPVDLSCLVSEAVLPFEPVFYESGRSLSLETEEELRVSGCEAQLRQLVEILLDNALKYSDPGGQTWVSLRHQGKNRCLLTVSDEGQPIPACELHNIFKRFYRADPARSRNGSFGLGLSIAETIAAQHRGKIWAESKNGLNRFLVELPGL